ncbi:hypothetical protein NDU88_006925 [Pleurodeles waltl]|uniref:Uncharacterized protein n=1 Tax=Pleurodeles waltl TaxID=8319 RepID=A0AAV7LS62_PLEWA|nr:hypothetical protein NDU88_006925 [Pleurodeles waltl]
MKGRPRVSSAGRFWLWPLLPRPSAARPRPRPSRGGLTTPARGTRIYSAGAASLVCADQAAAPGATRGPGLSRQGRPQARLGADRPILAPCASRIKDGGQSASGGLPQPSGYPPSLWHPRMERFLVQVLAAPPELGDQACAISR